MRGSFKSGVVCLRCWSLSLPRLSVYSWAVSVMGGTGESCSSRVAPPRLKAHTQPPPGEARVNTRPASHIKHIARENRKAPSHNNLPMCEAYLCIVGGRNVPGEESIFIPTPENLCSSSRCEIWSTLMRVLWNKVEQTTIGLKRGKVFSRRNMAKWIGNVALSPAAVIKGFLVLRERWEKEVEEEEEGGLA